MSFSLPTEVARALGISASAKLSSVPQGMTSEVVLVTDADRLSVLKRCRNPIYVEWLRREHKVLQWLAGSALASSALHIPRVLAYYDKAGVEAQPADVWLRVTYLPGETFWSLLQRACPRERSDLLARLGKLLRELHGTPPPPEFGAQRPWLDRKLEQARKNLGWCDGSAELLQRLEATKPAPWGEALIHGDFALDNVLVIKGGNLALIDWSDGDSGDPRYDLALALATEPEVILRGAEITAFFEGYGAAPLDPATTRWFRQLYEFF